MNVAPSPLDIQLRVLDAWLKLRSATEQRTNWYYVSLFVLFAAVATGFDKFQRMGRLAALFVVVVGLTGLLGAVGVTQRERSDTRKLNFLRTVTNDTSALLGPEYETTHITSYFMMLAGILFFILMTLLAYLLVTLVPPDCGI